MRKIPRESASKAWKPPSCKLPEMTNQTSTSTVHPAVDTTRALSTEWIVHASCLRQLARALLLCIRLRSLPRSCEAYGLAATAAVRLQAGEQTDLGFLFKTCSVWSLPCDVVSHSLFNMEMAHAATHLNAKSFIRRQRGARHICRFSVPKMSAWDWVPIGRPFGVKQV